MCGCVRPEGNEHEMESYHFTATKATKLIRKRPEAPQ